MKPTVLRKFSLVPILQWSATASNNFTVYEGPMKRLFRVYHFFIIRQHFSLDRLISLIYDIGVKRKRPANPVTWEWLASRVVRLREGSRLHLLGVLCWGFNSPQVRKFCKCSGFVAGGAEGARGVRGYVLWNQRRRFGRIGDMFRDRGAICVYFTVYLQLV